MIAALLIDDDTQVLASVERAVSTENLQIKTASSWDDGLAQFYVLSPDLVIADYNMPGSKHGLQLLAEVRKLRPSVRLVLVSGVLEDSDLDAVYQLGLVDRVLPKGTETVAALIEEIRSASEAVQVPTDWETFARLHGQAELVSATDLDALDRRLARKVECD